MKLTPWVLTFVACHRFQAGQSDSDRDVGRSPRRRGNNAVASFRIDRSESARRDRCGYGIRANLPQLARLARQMGYRLRSCSREWRIAVRRCVTWTAG